MELLGKTGAGALPGQGFSPEEAPAPRAPSHSNSIAVSLGPIINAGRAGRGWARLGALLVTWRATGQASQFYRFSTP